MLYSSVLSQDVNSIRGNALLFMIRKLLVDVDKAVAHPQTLDQDSQEILMCGKVVLRVWTLEQVSCTS